LPRHAALPKTNVEFWRKKLRTNGRRDRLVNKTLSRLGWRVVRLWEHDLTPRNHRGALARVKRALSLFSPAGRGNLTGRR
jgi:DNA mismatch endonuclease (patch repair protein)